MIYISFILLVISLIISLILGNSLIQFLRSIGIKQTIREDGPPEHITKKSKTPTIGGLIFLIPLFLLLIIMCFLNKELITRDLLVVTGITFIMAMLGFADDYLKILKKHNKGISGWAKLLTQLLVTLIIASIYNKGIYWFYLVWVFFIIAGSSNSYNLTDGLDGLVGSISVASLIGIIVLLFHMNKPELVYFSIILAGSIVGFLYFNKHPAKVFMGDTGSLAIGGAIGSLAIVTRSELYLICFSAIPVLEALSVILQVLSCQLSKRFLGKDIRIFKMAPLHHHFELVGWKEIDVVKRFFLFQIVCVLVGIMIVYLSEA